MALSFGFYNSFNGDRKYNANHMSSIFDGIIRDGVFMSIGTSLMVNSIGGLNVNVGIGRAWFNHTWTNNDSELTLTLSDAELVLNRIDAVILEIDSTESVRANSIKIVKGTPATNPVQPVLVKSTYKNQYPLAYIFVPKEVTEITQSNITNMIGTSEVPFVTGVLETMDVEPLIIQWQTAWYEWVDNTQADNEAWTVEQRDIFLSWAGSQEESFDIWFDYIKDQLDTDAAGNLQNQFNELAEQEFNRYYGLVNKQTSVNKDSSGNTQSIVETSSESVATTTFNDVSGNKIITTLIVPTEGPWQYTKTTTISNVSGGVEIEEVFTKNVKV